MKDRYVEILVRLRSSRSVDVLHREARRVFDGAMGVTAPDRVITTQITTFRKWSIPLEEIDQEGPST